MHTLWHMTRNANSYVSRIQDERYTYMVTTRVIRGLILHYTVLINTTVPGRATFSSQHKQNGHGFAAQLPHPHCNASLNIHIYVRITNICDEYLNKC